ncbi:MAG TPA: UDP-3-O-(3-hydroxymyristoyl)glucosamine N-acyltransferase [Terracidiphilus sp.]
MTVADLINELGGTLTHGDGAWAVYGVSSAERAGLFDLIFTDSLAAVEPALKSAAGSIVVKPGWVAEAPAAKQIIETDQPRLWFARAARMLARPHHTPGVHPTASVSNKSVLGPFVQIGPHAVVATGAYIGEESKIDAGAVIGEDVHIGSGCHIYPRVVIYPGVRLGNRVIVHAGAVLGADGFGYVRDNATGAYTQFPQQGSLVIDDDVEIGANTTIDRGALQDTHIRRGVKIDNLVHIGHNCDIGEDVILVALTGLSGSGKVGKGAVIAGQVGIGDHVTIGPGVILGGQSGVFNGKTLTADGHKPGTVFFGTPARPLQQVLREQATLARLAKKRGRTTETSE